MLAAPMRARLVTVLCVALLGACGETLRRPPLGKHAANDYAEVASKPPPPHVEEVGVSPDPRAAWVAWP